MKDILAGKDQFKQSPTRLAQSFLFTKRERMSLDGGGGESLLNEGAIPVSDSLESVDENKTHSYTVPEGYRLKIFSAFTNISSQENVENEIYESKIETEGKTILSSTIRFYLNDGKPATNSNSLSNAMIIIDEEKNISLIIKSHLVPNKKLSGACGWNGFLERK